MKLITNIRFLLGYHSLQCLPCLSVFLLAVCFLAGCNGHNIQKSIQDTLALQDINPYLYILEFDNDGKLISSEEPARAIRELSKNPDIDGVVVVSLGWNHDRDTIVSEYRELMNKYEEWKHPTDKEKGKPNKAVFVISWESSLTGASHFFGDLIPLPKTALDYLSKPFLPFTYWSKARQADRIGFGDLKLAMVEIVNDVNKKREQRLEQPLSLYVVGHSFGSRVVTGMLSGYDDKNEKLSGSKKFPKNTVKGGLLIEPALSSYELHSLAPKLEPTEKPSLPSYPLLVTESRHDHANRALFPVVNIPLNSAYLRYSGVFKSWFLGEVVGLDANKNSHKYETWSNGYDYSMFPFMIPYSAIMLVDSYLFGQFSEFTERGLDYIPDTLAQLPLLEVPVEFVNVNYTNPRKPDDYWGQRHKGLFHLGAMHESAATIVTKDSDSLFNRLTQHLDIGGTALVHPVCTQAELIERARQCDFSNGIIPIDMSEEIDTGLVGDLSTVPPLADWTIGWLDPIGAHNDYEIPEIYELIFRLLEQPKAKDKTIGKL